MGEAWRETEAAFREARLHFGHGTHNARDEAAWLLCHVADVPFDALSRTLDRPLTAPQTRRLHALAAKRIDTHAPLAYLIHEAWLRDHRFYVDRRTIVPRSFIAELLPDRLEPWIRPARVKRALDLCTGSGCLAILVALAYPDARVAGTDLSAAALAVARRNVTDYRLGTRVRLVRSDLFSALGGERYDLIVSNPPYVNAPGMRRLPAEYRHEPALALAGGRDGLDLVRRVLACARDHLAPRGILVVEIGHNRRVLERAFPQLPFTWLETSAGNELVFLLRREEMPNDANDP